MSEIEWELIDLLDLKKYKAKPDETVEEHTKRVVECAKTLWDLGYIKNTETKDLLIKSARYHDVGKVNSLFQERLETKKHFNKDVEVPHNILSYFMTDFKPNEYENDLVLYAVINHHHYVNNFKEIATQDKLLRNILRELKVIFPNEKQEFIKKQIIFKRNQANKIKSNIENRIKKEENLEPLIVLGLLNKCDYAASAHLSVEYPADFLIDKINNWVTNKSIALNELQNFCIKNRDKNLCVIGSTGMGKTEGALLWIGDQKGFFVLPLKTAINSIYNRIAEEILNYENLSKRVALLHGDTLDVYQKISTKESETLKDIDIIEYLNESKKHSMPLNITTPDQIFNFVFKYKGYEPKYAMMSYSKVVIDEIQAYSADLLSILILAVQKIIDIGGKVSIFTATLPPFIRDLLPKNEKNGVEIEKYKFEEGIFLNPEIRHNLKIVENEMTSGDIIQHYKNNNSRHKKYLVVCNTIKKAQEIYEEIAEELGKDKVKMLHSKYIKRHRKEKEDQIIMDGQTYIDNSVEVKKKELDEKDIIWISTQIVEASLDIDFDYLFTELSDLNGLFQRLGRVNRKGIKNTDEHNAYIFTEINKNILVRSDRDKGFIDNAVYELSKMAIINQGDGKISEEEKYRLIEKFLTTDNLKEKGSAFLEEYWELYDYYKSLNNGEISVEKAQKKLRNIISYDVFPVVEGELLNKDEIEGLINELSEIKSKIKDNVEEKKELILEYEKKKNELYSYSVSVGYYDINSDFEKDKIEISKGRNIYKSNCKYDDEVGYTRIRKEEKESFDSFI